MSPETKQKIETAIGQSPVVVFMKGTPDFPQCGFSAATVECLQGAGATFSSVNVLDDPEIRGDQDLF